MIPRRFLDPTAYLAFRAYIMHDGLIAPIPSRVARRIEPRLQHAALCFSGAYRMSMLEHWVGALAAASQAHSLEGTLPSDYATGKLLESGPSDLGSTLLTRYLTSEPAVLLWAEEIHREVAANPQGYWARAASLISGEPAPSLETSAQTDSEGLLTQVARLVSSVAERAKREVRHEVASIALAIKKISESLTLEPTADVLFEPTAGPDGSSQVRISTTGCLQNVCLHIEPIDEDFVLVVASNLPMELGLDDLVLIVHEVEIALAEPHPEGAAFLLQGLAGWLCLLDHVDLVLTTNRELSRDLNLAILEADDAGSLARGLDSLVEYARWVPEARVHADILEEALRSEHATPHSLGLVIEAAWLRLTSAFPSAWGQDEHSFNAIIDEAGSRFPELKPQADAALHSIGVFQKLVTNEPA